MHPPDNATQLDEHIRSYEDYMVRVKLLLLKAELELEYNYWY